MKEYCKPDSIKPDRPSPIGWPCVMRKRKVWPWSSSTRTWWVCLTSTLALFFCMTSHAAKMELDQSALAPHVQAMIDDDVVSDAERRRLQLFHGQWEQLDAPTITEQADIALQRYALDDPILNNPKVPTRWRAHGAHRRGEPDIALDLIAQEPDDDPEIALLRARCHLDRGRMDQAVTALMPIRLRMETEAIDDAATLTAAAESLALLAHLEGRPAYDYQLTMKLLGRARSELDQWHWPTMVAEARLLLAKDNRSDAAAALFDALALNPNSSDALYLLGDMSADGFNFDAVDKCLSRLREINPTHPLADLLETKTRMVQKDAVSAREAIHKLLSRFPDHRDGLALQAAADALSYDQEALQRTLARFEKLAPGSAAAYAMVGDVLGVARQYLDADAMLRKAIERQPNDPKPHIDLGLLLMQYGDDKRAHVVLSHATRLDPFNVRAANQLAMVEQLLGYERIETEHFIIKYAGKSDKNDGIDAVLARDMPQALEQIYATVTAAFEHQPSRKTSIEILPDERAFGVRITGIPDIWTIAASTGDVIAMTPPRGGSHQRGAFDWFRVIQHEFVHTVTLDQTRNRIPHWFTEACAVSQEPGSRDYNSCQLLAQALLTDRLFDLDEINFAFVRPKTPADRPLAYAQAHWMLEYITADVGHDAIIAMLEKYRDGVGYVAAVEQVLGVDRETFMTQFKQWAHQQIVSWGLGPLPDDPELIAVIESKDPIEPTRLQQLIKRYPNNPTLLRIVAEHAMHYQANTNPMAAQRAVLNYAAARSVDPWPNRQLVELAQRTGQWDQAIGALAALDEADQATGEYALLLANLHRDRGELDLAAHAVKRTLQRQPYNASTRELAATIELQRGDKHRALHHLQALAILEPEVAIHFTRLAYLQRQLGDEPAVIAAAERAVELDPNSPAKQFLSP